MSNGRLSMNTPTILRDWGLNVREEPGWQTRGSPTLDPMVLIGHHTGGSAAGGDYPSLRVVRDGRGEPNPLAGPLSQFGLGRSGLVYMIASGKANHAGDGHWQGFSENTRAVGIEAENNGSQPWPDVQLAAYDLLCAAILRDVIHRPSTMFCGHKEWATPPGRKPDPHTLSMPLMRQRIAVLMATGPHPHIPPVIVPPQEDDMKFPVFIQHPNGEVFALDLMTRTSMKTPEHLANVQLFMQFVLGATPAQVKVHKWSAESVEAYPLNK